MPSNSLLNLSEYYSTTGDRLIFDEVKASMFAKVFANDHNPIHDCNNDDFCIPGDLVLAVCHDLYGMGMLSQIKFHSPIHRSVALFLKDVGDNKYLCVDDNGNRLFSFSRGKPLLDYEEALGIILKTTSLTETLFEDAIYPQLKALNLMINPNKPSVLLTSTIISKYNQSESFSAIGSVESRAKGNVKRAQVVATYELYTSNDMVIGNVEKSLFISGLQDFCEPTMSNYKAMLDKQRYGNESSRKVSGHKNSVRVLK